MDNIEIIDKSGILLVDSRLFAEEFTIQHETLKKNISIEQEYLRTLWDEDFNPVSIGFTDRLIKQITPKLQDGSGGNTYYLLNEEQATYLMTLLFNSERVKEAKRKLITAFKQAKGKIKQLIKKQIDMETLLLEIIENNKLLREQQESIIELTNKTKLLESASEENKELKTKINNIETSGEKHSGSMHVIKAETKYTDDMQFVTVNSFLEGEGITIANPSKLRAIKLRAAEFYKASKHRKPLKNKKTNCIYSGADVQYIREAIFSETGIIFIDTLDLED